MPRKPAELVCMTDKAKQELKPKSLNELMNRRGCRSNRCGPRNGWPARRPRNAANSSATNGANCSAR